MTHRTQAEITLNLTRGLILRMWNTVPESKDFGAVESIQQCTQQPDLIKLGRKKKTITFSMRSFSVTGRNTPPDNVLGWQEIQ